MKIINDLGIVINSTLMYTTPLVFAAMGAMFSERTGVINIAIEGLMTIGAFAGVAVTIFTHNPWLGLCAAGLGGALFALLHAVACINFQADQTISGIAVNFLAPGVAIFACKLLFNGSTMTPSVPLSEKLPIILSGVFEPGSFLDNVFGTYSSVYLCFLFVVITWFIIYKTRIGLRIRAVGEHPHSAATLGINVYNIKYFGVLASGILAGIGGASITLATVSAYRPNVITGQGYIAIAAVIFGKYRPKATLFACLLFGFCKALVAYLGNPRVGINVSEHLLSMLPYLITLALLLFVGKSSAPASSGKPYKIDLS